VTIPGQVFILGELFLLSVDLYFLPTGSVPSCASEAKYADHEKKIEDSFATIMSLVIKICVCFSKNLLKNTDSMRKMKKKYLTIKKIKIVFLALCLIYFP
jgi:hypothetical protein